MLFLLACATDGVLTWECDLATTEVETTDSTLGFSAEDVVSAMRAAPPPLRLASTAIPSQTDLVGVEVPFAVVLGEPTAAQLRDEFEEKTGLGCYGRDGLIVTIPASVTVDGGIETTLDLEVYAPSADVGDIDLQPANVVEMDLMNNAEALLDADHQVILDEYLGGAEFEGAEFSTPTLFLTRWWDNPRVQLFVHPKGAPSEGEYPAWTWQNEAD